MGDCLGTAGPAGTGLVIQYAAQGRVDWEKYGQTQMFLNDTHFFRCFQLSMLKYGHGNHDGSFCDHLCDQAHICLLMLDKVECIIKGRLFGTIQIYHVVIYSFGFIVLIGPRHVLIINCDGPLGWRCRSKFEIQYLSEGSSGWGGKIAEFVMRPQIYFTQNQLL